MTALLKQKEKNMKAIQPEDKGYWLLTKGRRFIGRKMICLSEQQRNSASQRKKQCCSGNGNHNLYGLWQKMIKMNENTFPYGVCCHSD